jgi:hypothetical protein
MIRLWYYYANPIYFNFNGYNKDYFIYLCMWGTGGDQLAVLARAGHLVHMRQDLPQVDGVGRHILSSRHQTRVRFHYH